MTNALADASLEASAIGYVNAHATSTPAGDTAEARAIRRAGLGHAAVSSTKSVHGHTLGAAGGIESIAALMPIVRGVMPPTVNLEDPDDDQELDHVAGTSRRQRAEAVVSSQLRVRRPQRRSRVPRAASRLTRVAISPYIARLRSRVGTELLLVPSAAACVFDEAGGS